MRILLFMMVLCLVGCGPSASQIVTPGGEKGYFVRCESSKKNCYTKAINLCPTGYQVIDSENIAPTKNRSVYFEMLIQCDASWQKVNRLLKNK